MGSHHYCNDDTITACCCYGHLIQVDALNIRREVYIQETEQSATQEKPPQNTTVQAHKEFQQD